MTIADYAPTRPRKASAGTRRHHLKYLAFRIRQVVPGAHTLILLPVDVFGAGEQEFAAVVRDRAGVQLKLAEGAFTADWTRAQTWRADTNQLHVWEPPTAAYIASLESRLTESFADWDARQDRVAAAKAVSP